MKPSTFYIISILGFACGIWVLLALGSTLVPPADLSGTWDLQPEGNGPPSRLVVDQSGRHLKAQLDGKTIDLTVAATSDSGQSPALITSGGGISINWTPVLLPNQYEFTVSGIGASPVRYTAHRTTTPAPSKSDVKPGPTASDHGPVFAFLIQIGVILALSRIVGAIFAKFHQPQVVGEMLAGIMLGPSLLGALFPQTAGWLFPVQSTQFLNLLSQLGVIFFMFLVGLELDPKHLKDRGHTALVMSHVSIIAPFILGAALTLLLYKELFQQAPHMPFSSVALFMGAAMSITAFPVLARILTERNLHKTGVGALTITCAAVDDVTAWCMLAFVIGIARANALMPGLITAGLSLIYVLFMFFAVRPFLRRLQSVHDRQGRLSQPVIAVIFLLILASAWTTEAIGIHALFGAFLMGALMPVGSQFVRALTEKLEDFTVLFLLPIFFAYTGLRTQIGLLNSPGLWLMTGMIIVVACLGKFGGCAAAGRACGLSWRESGAVGILMNTRGLMELVILNIGYQEGVISSAVFAMMVIMALVTTGLTTPLLAWIYPNRLFNEERQKAKLGAGFSVLIPVALPESGAAMARLAATLVGKAEAGGKILALYLRRPGESQSYGVAVEQSDPTRQETLQPLIEQAATLNTPVEPISFISRDVANDISTVAEARHANLVVIGFHKPVFGKTILGGTVHRVLTQCETDVGIFVDRGLEDVRRVLVPFLGGQHDRLALELASRIARNSSAAVTVLHVVPPMRGSGRTGLDVRGNVDRVFADPTHPQPVDFRVVEDNSPVNVVLHEAANFDLVLLGVSEEWGLESRLFGWRPERIARECPASMLIVRKSAAARDSTDTSQAPDPIPAGVP